MATTHQWVWVRELPLLQILQCINYFIRKHKTYQPCNYCTLSALNLECKTVGVSLKLSTEVGLTCYAREARASHARRRVRREEKNRMLSVSPQSRSLFSASFQTLCLTVRAYLNTQKYGLFCSLLLISIVQFCSITYSIFR